MPNPRIYPAIKYRDPRAAIDWLTSVLGFEEHVVHAGEDGSIAHAELRLGDGIVMVETRKSRSRRSMWRWGAPPARR